MNRIEVLISRRGRCRIRLVNCQQTGNAVLARGLQRIQIIVDQQGFVGG